MVATLKAKVHYIFTEYRAQIPNYDKTLLLDTYIKHQNFSNTLNLYMLYIG